MKVSDDHVHEQLNQASFFTTRSSSRQKTGSPFNRSSAPRIAWLGVDDSLTWRNLATSVILTTPQVASICKFIHLCRPDPFVPHCGFRSKALAKVVHQFHPQFADAAAQPADCRKSGGAPR